MPLTLVPPALPQFAAAAPSTPLGPFADSAVTWTAWVTLMGFVGLSALALLAVGPAAARTAPGAIPALTARLARAAVVVGLLAVPAVLTDLAHGAAKSGGYDYAAAWGSLYDGSNDGRLSGLEVTFSLLGAALLAPLTVRRIAAGRGRGTLLGAGLAAGAIALGTTKFPDKAPDDWGRTVFNTLMWLLHLIGGGVWLGGLAGLLLIALPGGGLPSGLGAAERTAFWSATVRRFSAWAMGCVAAITLSGLFLYWEHVDGPTQLVTTMYGRVLGVKILIFGALLLLGMFNQFRLHPRIEALRAAGDQRPLATVLLRTFPAVVGVEVLLALAVLFVAPFLHGSARNQAYQADLAKHAATSPTAGEAEQLPKLAAKQPTASTWVWGTTETIAVIALMVGGYRVSGTLAARRTAAAAPAPKPASEPVRDAG
jgi:putative copper export protein